MATKNPTVEELDSLGRERLSKNFYMREFLHSEVATRFNIVNYPDDPEAALKTGRVLCSSLLEPLQDRFGRISIRSGFRSSTLNGLCHEKGFNCVENSKAYGRHIWDIPSKKYGWGAMACIVIPSIHDAVCDGVSIDEFACWIDSNLPYCFVSIFQNQTAVNVCCSENPKKDIYSRIEPSGFLFRSGAYVGESQVPPNSEKLATYISNWRKKIGD